MNFFDGIIHFISSVCSKMFDRFEDANSSTQTEVCFIHHRFVAGKRNHTTSNFNVAGSQLSKFLCQYFFQALECFGNQLEFLIHCGIIT